MTEDPDPLLAIARSISDGEPVDWERAEGGCTSEEQRRLLRHLKTLERLATLGRGSLSRQPGDLWGPLRIVARIGRGGFGEVFRAWDPQLDREVALKLLDAGAWLEADAPVVEEGRILARVRHPNVVTVYGAAVVDGQAGIWMELVHGQTLHRVTCDQGPIAAREAALIGLDLCRALGAVHRAGLLHRDIKAQNVMRERGGRIVLMDFGIARETVRAAEDPSTPRGTPRYVAPEVLEGETPSLRSDLYSLGVLLYHLVTGSYPVEGASIQEIREAHAAEKLTLLQDRRPDLPGDFVGAVRTALATRPGDRFGSAGEMENALLATVAASISQETSLAGRSPSSSARTLLWIPVAAACLAGLALLPRVWHRTAELRGADRGPAPESGTEDREYWRSLQSLAGLHEAMGEYAQARTVYERVLALQERSLGPDHVEVARTMAKLAWLLRALGSDDEAKALYARALAIYERRLGGAPQPAARSPADLAEPEPLDPVAVGRARTEPVPSGPPGRVGNADPFVRPLGLGQVVESAGAAPAEIGPYTIEVAVSCQAIDGVSRMGPETRLGADDQLLIDVTTSRPVWLYVLVEDAGDVSLFNPLPPVRVNPLPAHTDNRLPGPMGGRPLRVLLVASPNPLIEFEREIEALRLAGPPDPARGVPLSKELLSKLTEAGRLAGAHQVPSARLFPSARRVSSGLEMVRGLWIRQVVPPS